MLRGASAEARAELASKVGSGTLEDTATLGDELFAVAGVLRSEPALRRVFTDASVEGEAKAGLAAQRVRRQGRRPDARPGQGGRPAALDELPRPGRRARGARRSRRWSARPVPQGPRVSDELFAVGQLIDANPDLRDALSDPARSPDDKARAPVRGARRQGAATPRSASSVRPCGSSEPFGRALEHYPARRGRRARTSCLAVVHTARPLGTTEITRLTQALGKAYAATVHLHVVEDPDLIGGLRVEIGDDVIDGSVADQARQTPAHRRMTRPADRHRSTQDDSTPRHHQGRGNRDDGALDSSGGDPGRAPEVRRRLQAVGREPRRGRHRRRVRRRHRARRRPALGDGQRAAGVRGRHPGHRPEPRHPRDRRRRPR